MKQDSLLLGEHGAHQIREAAVGLAGGEPGGGGGVADGQQWLPTLSGAPCEEERRGRVTQRRPRFAVRDGPGPLAFNREIPNLDAVGMAEEMSYGRVAPNGEAGDGERYAPRVKGGAHPEVSLGVLALQVAARALHL